MTFSKMTSSKGLSYNEMRVLWNSIREGATLSFLGTNSTARFYIGYAREAGVDSVLFVAQCGHLRGRYGKVTSYDADGDENGVEIHDTFNSFWLVWGNWQEYKLVD